MNYSYCFRINQKKFLFYGNRCFFIGPWVDEFSYLYSSSKPVCFSLLGYCYSHQCWYILFHFFQYLLGITNFLCIIVFMSAVSKEVGYKIYPASEIDDPLFHYDYGYSFWLLKVFFSSSGSNLVQFSFLLTEFAALFSIVVYMAKRDERTFNRYKLRSMLNVHKISQVSSNGDHVVARENGHMHPRFKRTPPSSIARLLYIFLF